MRLLLSAVGAAAMMAVSSLALFVTSAPKWVSVAVEPLSLPLIPGVALSLLLTQAHDYTPWEVVRGAFGFHVVVLYVLLRWWDGRRGLAQR